MLVSFKLSKAIKIVLIIFVFSFSQGCSSEEKHLKSESLENPEELKKFVENGISEKDKKMAEENPYKGAMSHRKDNDWAAASKGFGMATLLYPTAKYLIYLSEAEAKFYTQIRFGDKVAIMTLKSIKNYLKGAIAVDSIQKKLTQSETEEVNSDIVCIGEFLKSKVKKDNCKYVNYVYKIPKKE